MRNGHAAAAGHTADAGRLCVATGRSRDARATHRTACAVASVRPEEAHRLPQEWRGGARPKKAMIHAAPLHTIPQIPLTLHRSHSPCTDPIHPAQIPLTLHRSHSPCRHIHRADSHPARTLPGWQDIKKHKWFRGLNWAALYNKQMAPPMSVPVLAGDDDHAHFPTCASIERTTPRRA